MQLSQREKVAVGLAGAAVLLFVLFQFVVFPLADKRARLVRGLAAKEKAVVEMRSLQERYRQLSSHFLSQVKPDKGYETCCKHALSRLRTQIDKVPGIPLQPE